MMNEKVTIGGDGHRYDDANEDVSFAPTVAPEEIPDLDEVDRLYVFVNFGVMTDAFNEWMRRYIEEPERFSREFEDIIEFKKAELEGRDPEYGESCAAYFVKLMNELNPVPVSA